MISRNGTYRKTPSHRAHCIRLALSGVLLALAAVLAVAPAQADDNRLLRGMEPAQVFEIALQMDSGATTHWFATVSDDLGVCDLSQPAESRACHLDLVSLAARFQALAALDYTQALPPSIRWDSSPSATPIALMAEIKAWDPASDQARRWTLVCSIVPDDPALAGCLVADRIDHFNYAMVNADQLLAIRPDGR
jgi:hypothetical protein